MANYETILFQVAGGVGRLTLNRPQQMNGVTREMLRELHDATRVAAADPELRVLVLSGAGKSFCPGADLKVDRSAAASVPDEPHLFRVSALLHDMPALTIAAVNGACAGAGMGWACGCDLRVAARSAMFNTAFLNVAIAGDMGLPWSLPRLVGAAKARELSFFTEKFNAEEARRIGLVARVWEDEAFGTEVDKLVARLAAASPLALLTMKAHYVAAERMQFGDFLDLEAERQGRIGKMEDTREAFRAFVEKRAPRFIGR